MSMSVSLTSSGNYTSPIIAPLTPQTFRLTNNFSEWPSWSYPDYRWLYCTNGHWVPGERNPLIGGIYIAEYLLFLSLYVPSLLVMASPAFLKHSCYKMMLAVGLMDIYNGFFVGFCAGVFSIMGANYCDNTLLLTGGWLVRVGDITNRHYQLCLSLQWSAICSTRPGSCTA